MRVIQVLPALYFGDAIGNTTLAIRDILREEGYETAIYTEEMGPRMDAEALDIRELPVLAADDVLIYHGSVGTDLNFKLPEYGGRQMMIYHNITPPRFFRRYSRDTERNVRYGYDGIRYLADKMEYCVAVSDYNRQELRRMGYTCPIDVCPIIIPFADYDREPDAEVLARYRGDGKKNWMFLGRVSPNKKAEDVIRAFACYKRDYEPESRLFLIGRTGGVKLYDKALENYIRLLGVEDSVIMPGHVTFAEILAYYHLADVFVCMSEHEGFCVPLVEAMYFGIPIAAFRSSAIPDTLGKGGLLLPEKDPAVAAAAVNRLLTDEALRQELRKGQEEKLKEYAYETVRARFLECLKHMTE